MAGYKSAKRARPEDDNSDVEVETKSTKTSKKAKTGSDDLESGKDSEGNAWWSLSGKRRIGISEFQKKPYVNIREYFVDAQGTWRPGKKGISLPLEQYNALLKVIPAVNAELAAQGLDVAEIPSGSATTNVAKAAPAERKKPKKSNIDVTSDEEEEDEDEDED